MSPTSTMRASGARRHASATSPSDRDERQRRPHEEAVLRRDEHLERVRRRPRHLARHEMGRADVTVQHDVRPGLRQVDDPGDDGAHDGGGDRLHGRHIASPCQRPQEIDGRRHDEERVLLAHHREDGRESAEQRHAAHAPRVADAQPAEQKRRHREGGRRVRHGRCDVHVEDERRAEPDDQRRQPVFDRERRPPARDVPDDGRGEQHAQEAVERRPIGHRHDVRARVAVDRDVPSGGVQAARDQVADRVERRPQQRASDRSEVEAQTCFGRALEVRLVEARRRGHAVIVEPLVLVLEREVVIEPDGPQEREIQHFVRRVDPRGDGRQRDEKDEREQYGRHHPAGREPPGGRSGQHRPSTIRCRRSGTGRSRSC